MLDEFEKASVPVQVIKINPNGTSGVEDRVVVEKALTVYLNGEEFITMICSPGQERELVTGFLCSEGIISRPEELANMNFDYNEGLVWVETTAKSVLSEKLFLKRYLTSCCGKGRSSFYFANDARITRKIESDLKLTPQQALYFSSLLEEKSELFHLTGGVHSGALASGDGFDCFAFDIGRHNVLDKLFGWAFAKGYDLSREVLVFSGRISSEILIKTAKMGCPIIVARSAPTDLALNLAEELDITVIGFARRDRLNLYTHPGRVMPTP